jgi:transcriptional regulator NrdR family protein
MVCIYCQSPTQVVNSRHQKRQNQVWRRRKCLNCHAVFSTLEAVDTEQAVHVLTNKGSAAFSRDKLLISIYESLKHRKTALTDATALTNTIWGKLQLLIDNATLLREQVIEVTATTLEHFDEAAAVHYRAFHQ